MPFDDEDDQSSKITNKVALKKVSSKKSIFDDLPKKPSQEEFDQKVTKIQNRALGYQSKAADLASKFNKSLSDRTLKINKNIFSKEMEKEILVDMVQLAEDINNDPNEKEGMGSLSWITLLLKICFYQRDRLNELDYNISKLEKKIEDLDKLKNNE